MKTEFELSLDVDGRPCIRFRHYDKDASLEQKILNVFIESIRENGCTLKNTSGFLEAGYDGTERSFQTYEVQIETNI